MICIYDKRNKGKMKTTCANEAENGERPKRTECWMENWVLKEAQTDI